MFLQMYRVCTGHPSPKLGGPKFEHSVILILRTKSLIMSPFIVCYRFTHCKGLCLSACAILDVLRTSLTNYHPKTVVYCHYCFFCVYADVSVGPTWKLFICMWENIYILGMRYPKNSLINFENESAVYPVCACRR